jgi:hypothetical protein
MKNMPTGDGHGFGIVLALIMIALGASAFVSKVGLSRATFLINRAAHGGSTSRWGIRRRPRHSWSV